MAVGVIHGRIWCRFNNITQHFLPTRWFIGSFSHQIKQFHGSKVTHNDNFNKLIDQGRKSVLKLKNRDNVPENYQLIYKASMELLLRILYPTVLFCSVGFVGLILYRECNKDNLVQPKRMGRDKTVMALYPEQDILFFSTALVLSALAGFSIMFKYPFRVYKHSCKREYVAIFLSPFPMRLKQVEFKTATPTKFKNPLYFFLQDCHYVLDNKKKLFFMSQFFRIPKDLTDMYEEPKNTS